ncbi:MAG TPA: fumarylacetoacetate hydrolase family protein [Nitrososphaerales archaeon]|nr:fumarylacetoacetate hydrolase family protein [Nitrososphaerales archaeon]
MKICIFSVLKERPKIGRIGLIRNSRVFALTKQTSMIDVIASGEDAESFGVRGHGYDLEQVVLSAPIQKPGKILATIVNTKGMLGGNISLDRPRVDMKAPSSIIGPGEEIRAPPTGIRPEVELAAVVGRKISKASINEARESIYGYTVLNDVTAPSDSRDDAYEAFRRDKKTGEIRKTTLRGPLFRSKNHDTFCPLGPWIVTADEDPGWSDLRMTTKFDGALVQDGSTSEYIFSPEKIASYISGFLTLEPGDIVSCGSVGWAPGTGEALDPTEFVLASRSGVLELEVEGIGILRNPVVRT